MTNIKSLNEIYSEHVGKVSDKWSLYLTEYDRLFSLYQKGFINLLEIGLQNGGSLEIWSKYFENAANIVGCDINPECANLQYDDPRISYVIGDVNSDSTQSEIIQHSPNFDIVIDDGSHESSDIVKSFSRYFPMVNDGGIFVVEDLHCSYWQEFEGGLFEPFSSVMFFKYLADVINFEHWGIKKQSSELFKGFFQKYEFEMDENLLRQVHSVEFLNSMCIIRKSPKKKNVLGSRVVAGEFEGIVSGHRKLAGQTMEIPPQNLNNWSLRDLPPSEELLIRLHELAENSRQILSFEDNAKAQNVKIASLERLTMEHKEQIEDLQKAVGIRDFQLSERDQVAAKHEKKIATLTSTAKKYGAQIADLNQAEVKRNGQIAHLKKVAEARDAQLSDRDRAVVKHERKISALTSTAKRYDAQIADLNQAEVKRNGQIAHLKGTIETQNAQLSDLEQVSAKRNVRYADMKSAFETQAAHVVSLNQVAKAYQTSTSWKLTKPIRFLGHKFRQTKALTALITVPLLNFRQSVWVVKRLRKVGFTGVERQLDLLKSNEYAAQFATSSNLSPQFLKVMIKLGTISLAIKRWWLSTAFVEKFAPPFISYLRGETKNVKAFLADNIFFSIDNPRRIIQIAKDSFVISGWCVDLNACDVNKVRVRIGETIYYPHLKQREDVRQVFSAICEMPIDLGFCVIPTLSIGLHRMRIDIKSRDGAWRLAHRALLFRVPKNALWKLNQNPTYKNWSRTQEKQLKAELPELKQHISVMIHKPVFTIVIDTRQNFESWELSLNSIQQQIYPHYELCVLSNGETIPPRSLEKAAKCLPNLELDKIQGDFVVFIDSGQSLSSDALYEFANAINRHPDLDLIYGNEDHFNAFGERNNPFYKPNWSPDYLETFNYIGFPTCFRTSIVRNCNAFCCAYDLVLRFTERTTNITHLPKILGHQLELKINDEDKQRMTVANIAALQGRLDRTGRQGTVRQHELHHGCYDIELDLKYEPLVSVIIPTAGKMVTLDGRKIDLITNIVDQIRNQSNYKNVEIIVIDNDDLSNKQKQLLAENSCKRLTFTETMLNIPKKLNMGASVAKGELLLLMNDDIEVISPFWIERMIEHFEKPHVGVVGARLLYPDGKTQHVGVVHNNGNPDHVRRLFPGDESGYYYSTSGVHNYMAVTGAVMMTRSSLYREIGGV